MNVAQLLMRIEILEQEVEALSALNRWAFAEKYGRQAQSDNELVIFYVESGGAKRYRFLVQEQERIDEQLELENLFT